MEQFKQYINQCCIINEIFQKIKIWIFDKFEYSKQTNKPDRAVRTEVCVRDRYVYLKPLRPRARGIVSRSVWSWGEMQKKSSVFLLVSSKCTMCLHCSLHCREEGVEQGPRHIRSVGIDLRLYIRPKALLLIKQFLFVICSL